MIKRRILIVDDDEVRHASMVKVFAREPGCAIVAATTLAEADHAMADQNGSPEAIVLDHPDAPLFDACAAFDVLERQGLALTTAAAAGDEHIRQLDEIVNRQRPLLNVIVDHRASSLEANRARARSLALWAKLGFDDDAEADDWEARLWKAMIRDLS